MPVPGDPAKLALTLAGHGWHILPFPASKRPLGNCPRCQPAPGALAHLAPASPACPAVAGPRLRAATTDPHTITTWWQRQPRAIPGAAAGPSGLVLIDIDAHGGPLPPIRPPGCCPAWTWPPNPSSATPGGPGPVPRWPRQPHPPSPAMRRPAAWRPGLRISAGHRRHAVRRRAPVVPGTCRRAPPGPRRPARTLRACLAGRHQGRMVLRHRPGAASTAGTYRVRGGDPGRPGRMPAWLAREILRVTATAPARRGPTPAPWPGGGSGPAAYLTTVITRGAAELATMADGRKAPCRPSPTRRRTPGLVRPRPRPRHRPAHRRRHHRRG